MAKKNQRRNKLRVYFDTGADAIERVVRFNDPPYQRRLYLCPLCCTFYDSERCESGALTFEHVPPRSVGGVELTLTCAHCNNLAGTALDHHAAKRKKADDLLQLRRGEGPVKLRYGINAHMRVTDGPVYFDVDPRHNDPTRFAAFNAEIGRRFSTVGAETVGVVPQFSFGVPISHDEWKANLSYLRAAYLTVFALYGYRLILGASYQLVRRQLRDIDQRVIKRLVVGMITSGSESGLQEGYIHGLGPLIVVQFHDRWVGLPHDTSDVAWWDRALAVEPYTRLLARNRQSLPIRPTHIADFSVIPREGRSWIPLDFYGDGVAA